MYCTATAGPLPSTKPTGEDGCACQWEAILNDVAAARHALSQHRAVPLTLEYDLGGKEKKIIPSNPASHLVLPHALTLRLANGHIILPPGCGVEVGPGATLELSNISLEGTDVTGSGLLTVRGRDASARLRKCDVMAAATEHKPSLNRKGQRENWCHAVYVVEGGHAVLGGPDQYEDRCFLSAEAGRGLSVEGAGSRASATYCKAEMCDDGFAACDGGHLVLQGCEAHKNNRAGFYAEGRGSQLLAGHGCKATANSVSGFQASMDAHLIRERRLQR